MNPYAVGDRLASLQGLTQPARVYLRGRICSTDCCTSPLTGVRGAVIQWQLLVKRAYDQYEQLYATGIIGEELTVEAPGGHVRVATEGLQIYVAATNGTTVTIVPELLDALAGLVDPADLHAFAARRELRYRELALPSGLGVRLRATVSPIEHVAAYRDSGGAPFVARGDLEPPVLSQDVPEFA
jgi:hypothetical protein